MPSRNLRYALDFMEYACSLELTQLTKDNAQYGALAKYQKNLQSTKNEKQEVGTVLNSGLKALSDLKTNGGEIPSTINQMVYLQSIVFSQMDSIITMGDLTRTKSYEEDTQWRINYQSVLTASGLFIPLLMIRPALLGIATILPSAGIEVQGNTLTLKTPNSALLGINEKLALQDKKTPLEFYYELAKKDELKNLGEERPYLLEVDFIDRKKLTSFIEKAKNSTDYEEFKKQMLGEDIKDIPVVKMEEQIQSTLGSLPVAKKMKPKIAHRNQEKYNLGVVNKVEFNRKGKSITRSRSGAEKLTQEIRECARELGQNGIQIAHAGKHLSTRGRLLTHLKNKIMEEKKKVTKWKSYDPKSTTVENQEEKENRPPGGESDL